MKRILAGVLVAVAVVSAVILLGLFTLPDDERPWMKPIENDLRAKLGVAAGTPLVTMTYSFEESAAIPALRYVIGWYPNLESPDRVFSVVAYRDDVSMPLLRRLGIGVKYHLLSTPRDWVAASSGWWPASAQEAVSVCSEVTRLVGPRANPEDLLFDAALLDGGPHASGAASRLASLGRPEPSSDPGNGDAREAWDQRIGDLMHEPRAERSPDGWLVDFWVVEFARATRYTCRVGVSGDATAVSTVVADSTRGLAKGRDRD